MDIHLPPDQKKQLEALARERGSSVQELVREFVGAALANGGGQNGSARGPSGSGTMTLAGAIEEMERFRSGLEQPMTDDEIRAAISEGQR